MKPAKPYPDFPLFAHASGVWAKKIRSKTHYFGPWDDPSAALRRYLAEQDTLYAYGRCRHPKVANVTIQQLIDRFLEAKGRLLNSNELAPRSLMDYRHACTRIAEQFGAVRQIGTLEPEEFERFRAKLANGWGPVTLGAALQKIRTVFKYAFDAGLIERPVRFGVCFKSPSKRVLRLNKKNGENRMFEAEEVRRMLETAGVQLRAMILLGVNCGFGNADCATLPIEALDLDGGWINYHRPKTGIDRRCPLWPETVAALRKWLARRPRSRNPEIARLVFVTRNKTSWSKGTTDNPVAKAFAKVLGKVELVRKGRGFYALRHTFETIAGEALDQIAVDAIMGHVREDMATVYRERINDERLRYVAERVRTWLFVTAA